VNYIFPEKLAEASVVDQVDPGLFDIVPQKLEHGDTWSAASTAGKVHFENVRLTTAIHCASTVQVVAVHEASVESDNGDPLYGITYCR
jgi:hypothetical protein